MNISATAENLSTAPLARSHFVPPLTAFQRKEKNFLQKIIEWIGSFFFAANADLSIRRDMRAFFKEREVVWQRAGEVSIKGLEFLQKFFAGKKQEHWERSEFERRGLSLSRVMDGTYLDLALHRDPSSYLEAEKTSLERYRIQVLQQTAQSIRELLRESYGRAVSKLEQGIEAEIVMCPEQCSAQELRVWVGVIEPQLRTSRAKTECLERLNEIIALTALKETRPQLLDREILAHYLGVLKIQEKAIVENLASNELSRGETRALEILSRRLSRADTKVSTETGRLDRFIAGALGNLDLNARLKRFSEQHHLTICPEAIEIVLDISYKTARLETYRSTMERVAVLQTKLDQNEEIGQNERLSLGEVQKVESFARLHRSFEALQGVGAPSSHFLVGVAKRADRFVSQVLQTAEKECPHKSGSVILYDYPNAVAYLNWPNDLFRRFFFKYLIQQPILHAAVGVSRATEGGSENVLSHMYQGKHVYQRRSMGEYVFKTFELDFPRLVSPRGLEVLEKKMGSAWIREVESMYEEIVRHIHMNNFRTLKQFKNTSWKQLLAALHIGFAPWKNRAHEHRPIDEVQICSSFVLNASLEAFVSLEEKLRERFDLELKAGEEPLSADFRFLEIPIRKHRIIDFVLPHQLLHYGLRVAKESKIPSIIRKILNFKEYSIY
ncbi:MAG: hypothetical protein HY861_01950 [Chlamydiia bacterium]|nr:hypothetical protein [Chlamydiia bacterium]